jgi:GNAT superfamily N-acetyltransferase
MMTLANLDRPTPLLPQGYRLVLDAAPAGAVATVVAPGGAVAASGRVATVGKIAIFDRIGAEPSHQRRGLGTVVMAALGQAARDRGARRAVLVATADGRHLYETLGWRLHALYASAVIVGPPA